MGLNIISYSHLQRVHDLPLIARGLLGKKSVHRAKIEKFDPNGELIVCSQIDGYKLLRSVVADKLEGLYQRTSKTQEASTGNIPYSAWHNWRNVVTEIHFKMPIKTLWKLVEKKQIAFTGIVILLSYYDNEGCWDAATCRAVADDMEHRIGLGGPPDDGGLYSHLIGVFRNGARGGLVEFS